MNDYVKKMLESVLITLGKNNVALTPASEDFWAERNHSNKIGRESFSHNKMT